MYEETNTIENIVLNKLFDLDVDFSTQQIDDELNALADIENGWHVVVFVFSSWEDEISCKRIPRIKPDVKHESQYSIGPDTIAHAWLVNPCHLGRRFSPTWGTMDDMEAIGSARRIGAIARNDAGNLVINERTSPLPVLLNAVMGGVSPIALMEEETT